MDTCRELNVEIPKEIESMKQAVHRFAKQVVRPAAVQLDRLTDPRDVIALDSPLRSVFKQAYQLRYNVAGLPTELGGMGLRGLGMHVLIEELSWGAVDVALSLLCASFPFTAAAASGNPELYEKFIKPFVADRDGSLIGCWAITEPQHGSDELVPGTPQFHNPRVSGQVVVRADGDSYVINGQKAAWVSNGTLATHAALYLTTQPRAGMAGGGIAFVPLNLPGVSKGKPLNKLGQRALNQGEIYFDEVRIPRGWMLTAADGYERELARTLTFANTAMAAAFTGLARAAYEDALDYSKQRVQGGRAICEHQLVQKHLFEMFTKVEASRALSRAAMIYNQTSATPSLEHAIAAKTFCTEAAFQVASDALQIFGGNGLSKEYGIEKLFRDARAALIEDGTTDVLSLVGARNILSQNGVTQPAIAN
ncbi:MAG TPA: acyl-CoA dehydrogenase [Candidatus Binataceae bacterium]|nr:acyl-CoA dehydrogenase [Candidatus Binataceae bacterium]